MMLVPCPWCGPRNASEFRHVGDAGVTRPDPETTTPEEWRTYLYFCANRCGWVTERWFHRAGCRAFFTLTRHTLTNEFRAVERPDGAAEPAGGALETVR